MYKSFVLISKYAKTAYYAHATDEWQKVGINDETIKKMARPNKTGIDYFPFDVDFFVNDKLQLIESEFGMKGGYITIRLLCKIYKNGYYYKWGADECLLFAKNMGIEGVSANNVDEVVRGLLRRGFFDETAFKSFSVLTSKGIQRRYVQATGERKEVEVNVDYWLIELPKNVPKIVNPPTNEVNRSNNSINRSNNTHSIVKETKLNNLYLENAAREISDREREIFFEILFFEKGIKSAQSEVERFVNHYQSTGWVNKNGVAIHDRCSLLRNWDTKGAAAFPPEFVKNWREMYELSAKLNPDKVPIFSFISEFYDMRKTETNVTFLLSEKLRSFIENNLDIFQKPLRKIIAARNLNYEIK